MDSELKIFETEDFHPKNTSKMPSNVAGIWDPLPLHVPGVERQKMDDSEFEFLWNHRILVIKTKDRIKVHHIYPPRKLAILPPEEKENHVQIGFWGRDMLVPRIVNNQMFESDSTPALPSCLLLEQHVLGLLLGTLSIHKPHGSVRKGNIWIAGHQSLQ